MFRKTLLISTLLLSNAVFAEQGFYLGGFVGKSSFDASKNDISNVDIPEWDNSDTGYKLVGGYQFNRYFSTELGYTSLGALNFTNSTDIPHILGIEGNSYEVSYMYRQMRDKVDGVFFALNGNLPIYNKLDAYVKIGAYHSRVQMNGRDSVDYYIAESDSYGNLKYTIDEQTEKTSIFYGLGLSYQLEPFLLQIEYEIYNTSIDDISLLSIGATYHF